MVEVSCGNYLTPFVVEKLTFALLMTETKYSGDQRFGRNPITVKKKEKKKKNNASGMSTVTHMA